MVVRRQPSPTPSRPLAHYVSCPSTIQLMPGFYCMQTGHCSKGMVFAINPPATGPKTFQNFKNLAMGKGSGASTVLMTAIASTVVIQSVPASMASPPPPPVSVAPVSMLPPSSGSESCNCVCNMDIGNGPVNALQGINDFGGQVGNVQSTISRRLN